ncbi:MAG: hypothetical protein QXX30_00305 [Candidatus Aenigmatarchaeota archaeon]
MEKVELLRQEVEAALKEKLYPLPPFGLQVLLEKGEIAGAKVYLPLVKGWAFDPNSGDILLGRKVIFPNGVLGKFNGIYVQVRLARYILPGTEVIRK